MKQEVTINSRAYDGSIRRSWRCELIEQNAVELVFIGTFEFDVVHADLGSIKAGTISYEYYWLDRWYNVFAFFDPNGTFRNYYCNVNLLPTFNGSELNYVDLDLDLVVWPDGRAAVLDREDFERNAERFAYSPVVIAKAESALAELLRLANERKFPVPHHMHKVRTI